MSPSDDDATIDRNDLPLSFGAFKPVGHVAVVLPDDQAGTALAQALLGEGFPEAAWCA